jgi:hypothetical protein
LPAGSTSVAGISDKNVLNVYPNPTVGGVCINLSGLNNVSSVNFYNVAGALVHLVLNKTGEYLDIPAEMIQTSGMHFIEVMASGQSHFQKLIRR